MAKTSRRRGRFIVLEGIDGAGTSTQLRHVVEWLAGRGELVHATHQPTDGPIGGMIRQILRGRLISRATPHGATPVDPAVTALLFAADRLDHLAHSVIPKLDAGVHVVCDRYVVSSFAYQSLETDLRFVRQINEKALAPDITVFLKVRPEIAMARVERRAGERDTFEQLAIQRQVADAYEKLLADYRASPVVTIDGEAQQSQVTAKVRGALESLF